jgi:hypothetical protein
LLEIGYKTNKFWFRIKKKITKPDGTLRLKTISFSEYSIRNN